MLINRVLYVYTSTQSEKSGIRITSKSVKDRGILNSDISTPWLSMVPAMSKVYLLILCSISHKIYFYNFEFCDNYRIRYPSSSTCLIYSTFLVLP